MIYFFTHASMDISYTYAPLSPEVPAREFALTGRGFPAVVIFILMRPKVPPFAYPDGKYPAIAKPVVPGSDDGERIAYPITLWPCTMKADIQ